MIKYIIVGIGLFFLTSCVGLQQLPQASLNEDVLAADAKFTKVVSELHSEYNKDHICPSKLAAMQNVVRRANKYLEMAYDAATLNNITTVAKLLTRIETLRRDLELDLEIAKSGEPLNGCASNSDGTIKFTPAFT